MHKNKKNLIWKLILVIISIVFITRGLIQKTDFNVAKKPAFDQVITNTPPVVPPVIVLEPEVYQDNGMAPKIVVEPMPDIPVVDDISVSNEMVVVTETDKPVTEPVSTNTLENMEDTSLLDALVAKISVTNETEMVEEPVVTNMVVEVAETNDIEVAAVVPEIMPDEDFADDNTITNYKAKASIPIMIEKATTRGRVVLLEDSDEGRYVVRDVPVAIWHIDKNGKERLMYSTRTDDDGMFSLPEIEVGIYRAIVGKTPMLMQIVPTVNKLKEQERAAPKALLIMMPKQAI